MTNWVNIIYKHHPLSPSFQRTFIDQIRLSSSNGFPHLKGRLRSLLVAEKQLAVASRQRGRGDFSKVASEKLFYSIELWLFIEKVSSFRQGFSKRGAMIIRNDFPSRPELLFCLKPPTVLLLLLVVVVWFDLIQGEPLIKFSFFDNFRAPSSPKSQLNYCFL